MTKVKIRSRFTAGVSALALAAGLAVASAVPATAAPLSAEAQGAVALMSAWQEDYRHNYFYSEESCNKRGYAMKYYEHVPGFLNWSCHLHPGETKWSMDVLWST